MNITGPSFHLPPRRFAIGFALLIAAWFAKVLFAGESFVLRDFGVFGYPLAHFHRTAFWHAELPLWNPLSYAGIPWLAQWNTLLLYPGSLLYLIPPLPWSLNFYCLVHLWLAGFGMYLLARHWLTDDFAAGFAGIAYGLGGLLQNSLMWPNNIAAFAWLPFVLLTLGPALQQGGRAWLLSVLTGSLQMLTGAPEIILLTWIGAAAIAPFITGGCPRTTAIRFVLLTMAIAAVCAVQLLPFLDFLRHSSRAATGGESAWALGPKGWLNFYVPLFETRTKATGAIYHASQAWTHSFYAGLLVIALALLGLKALPPARRWFCGGGLLLSLVLATGFSPDLPPFNLIRFPVKFVIVWIVMLPLLAGAGIRVLRQTDKKFTGALGISVGLAVIGALLIGDGATGQLPDKVVLGNFAWRLLGSGIAIACLLKLRGGSTSHPTRLPLLVLGLLTLDLLTHQPGLHPAIDSRWFTEPNPVMAEFEPDVIHGDARVHPVKSRQMQTSFNVDASLLEAFQLTRISMAQNWNLVEGVAKVNGFYSLWTLPQKEISEALFRDPPDLPEGLADFLAIRNLSAEENTFDWPRRDTGLPLVNAGQQPRFAAAAEILKLVTAIEFNPRDEVWLPTEAAADFADFNATDVSVTNVLRLNEALSFQYSADGPAVATIATSFYPAWQAYIDGERTRIHRANHGFMALAIPAGEHEVELVYEDGAFTVGRWLTLMSLVALAIAWRRLPDQACPPKAT